jgi:hypothetical protein
MYKILHKKLGGGVGSEEHICVLSSQIISQHVREREREDVLFMPLSTIALDCTPHTSHHTSFVTTDFLK